MTKAYRTSSGILMPGRLLGRGGEGEVFALADASPRAIKIYGAPDPAREAKVRSMAAAKLSRLCPGVAFPEAPAYAEDGSFAGFVMPLVENGQPVHELCSPTSRRSIFPNADWRFLVRTAVNAARIFDRVHSAGAVIGDVNGSGVLVSKRAAVSLIDADSFQWGTEHLCRVGVPEFTPPELQGRSLTGIARTVQHDAFGLAVLIFQLLFNGRHPHAGVPKGRDLPLPDAIGQNCFVYSRIQTVRLAPPGGTLLLTDLPLGVSTLFERAFAGLGPRPLPREWIAELVKLEETIVACDRKDGHYLSAVSRKCPWCRIESKSRSPIFGSGADVVAEGRSSRSTGGACAIVAKVLARARTEAGEGLRPPMPPRLPPPSALAIDFLERMDRPGMSELLKPFVAGHRKARRSMHGALEAWRNRVGAWTVAKSASELAALAMHGDAHVIDPGAALSRIEQKLRAQKVENVLRQIPLTAAGIPGFGERGAARLSAAGIRNAADLTRTALAAVHGMGEKGIVALLLWRDISAVGIEQKTTLDPAEISAACEELQNCARQDEANREQKLMRLADKLHAALDELAVRAKSPDERLLAAVGAYQQALADLTYLGLPEDGHSTAPKPIAQTSHPKTLKGGGTACPLCGGPMVKRWARTGLSPSRFFLGCSAYPSCRGSRPLRSRRP